MPKKHEEDLNGHHLLLLPGEVGDLVRRLLVAAEGEGGAVIRVPIKPQDEGYPLAWELVHPEDIKGVRG